MSIISSITLVSTFYVISLFRHFAISCFKHAPESPNSIDILIGSDHYWDLVKGESIRGDFGPTAVKTWLGWLLSGPTNNSQNKWNVVSNLVILGESFSNEARKSDEMADILKRFWNVESLRILDTDCKNELVNQKGEITFNGTHYEVGLPWKGDCLPNLATKGDAAKETDHSTPGIVRCSYSCTTHEQA